MDEFNKMTKQQQIGALCRYHECSDKQAKAHYNAYVFRNWNPHPPTQFMQWWPQIGWLQTEARTERAWQGVHPVTAFNCEAVREVYREGKDTGTLWEQPEDKDPDKGLSVKERINKLKATIRSIGKPMPKVEPGDIQKEQQAMGQDIEPIDF